VVKELHDDAKKYGDERRTLIKRAERAQVERTVVEEPITVILSQKAGSARAPVHGLICLALTLKMEIDCSTTLECKTTDA
jgi:topoisomerase-4 subunit A